jgi:hypothetical protein
MKLPQASMTTTLFVTLVFAIDFGITRDLLSHDRGDLSDYGLGFLPMATALVFGLYRLVRLQGEAGAFTVGFVAVGLAASGGFLAAIRLVPALNGTMGRLCQAMDDRILAAFPGSWGFIDLGFDEMLVLAAILSIPPGLLALAGGWLARRIAKGREAASHQRKGPRAWKRPRFTLLSASILVAVLAVDLGVAHHLARTADFGPKFDRPIGGFGPWLAFLTPWGLVVVNRWVLFAIGFLPMVNLLFFGLPGLIRTRRRSGSFLLGFEVVGWLATLACVSACAIAPESMLKGYYAFDDAVVGAIDFVLGQGQAHRFFLKSSHASLAVAVAFCAAFFTVPPLVAALSGGAICRRSGRKASAALDPSFSRSARVRTAGRASAGFRRSA